MDTTFKNAFEFKVIYVFTIDDQAHKGPMPSASTTLEHLSFMKSLHGSNCSIPAGSFL